MTIGALATSPDVCYTKACRVFSFLEKERLNGCFGFLFLAVSAFSLSCFSAFFFLFWGKKKENKRKEMQRQTKIEALAP